MSPITTPMLALVLLALFWQGLAAEAIKNPDAASRLWSSLNPLDLSDTTSRTLTPILVTAANTKRLYQRETIYNNPVPLYSLSEARPSKLNTFHPYQNNAGQSSVAPIFPPNSAILLNNNVLFNEQQIENSQFIINGQGTTPLPLETILPTGTTQSSTLNGVIDIDVSSDNGSETVNSVSSVIVDEITNETLTPEEQVSLFYSFLSDVTVSDVFRSHTRQNVNQYYTSASSFIATDVGGTILNVNFETQFLGDPSNNVFFADVQTILPVSTQRDRFSQFEPQIFQTTLNDNQQFSTIHPNNNHHQSPFIPNNNFHQSTFNQHDAYQLPITRYEPPSSPYSHNGHKRIVL